MLKKKAIFVLYAAVYAYGVYLLTAFIFTTVARGDILVATIWNLAIIVTFVFLEKIENFAVIRLKSGLARTGKQPGIPKKLLISYLSGASIKSALYLYYIVILALSAILAADPEFSALQGGWSGYLLSMRYGILVLIATDKFFDQIFKDIKGQN